MKRQLHCSYRILGNLVKQLYPVEYEWDEGKRLSNRTKHGVDFSEIERFRLGYGSN